ncbi:hypothetical protein F2Q69_00020805 [Brassica cretica]|uniref:Uncharacterized protein n=1 Tax=Brassica cretica TaxID=69181 RepID=A0A8S9QI83_BRACR|nr:hypothetical protein F2Q69_00020805 [Brassica cretica]
MVNQRDGVRLEGTDIGGFVIGSGRNISTERHTRSRNSQSSRSSWARRNQNKRKSVPTGSDNGLSERAETLKYPSERGWKRGGKPIEVTEPVKRKRIALQPSMLLRETRFGFESNRMVEKVGGSCRTEPWYLSLKCLQFEPPRKLSEETM